MTTQHKLDVVLCWHMHQPWYLSDGEFVQPWVYLHGLKSYADMAGHLASVPGARAVVNFAPTLLEQIDLYVRNIDDHLQRGAALTDPLLAALVAPSLPQEPGARRSLIDTCLMTGAPHVLERFPGYARLAALAGRNGGDNAAYLSDQFIADLLVWFHLTWFGEFSQRNEPALTSLAAKGKHYTFADRRALLTQIGRELGRLLPRYRALAEDDRVELSVSPWAHPIVPLLLDFGSGRDALPHLALPDSETYPGGEERARWHLQRARAAFEACFGRAPAGCWPSEGAVSAPTLRLLEAAGFRWCASGGAVLGNSLSRAHTRVDCQHRPFRVDDGNIRCFFRDDGLSDLLGFVYKDWHADDAVDNLIGHLENIASHCDCADMMTSIIMDGENAWEHYPSNGFDFLQTLYHRLAEHPRLRLTTFSEYLARPEVRPAALPSLVAGSWVHGTLSTWIGNRPRNRAWELLVAAKQRFDAQPAEARAADGALSRELALCEGSDWFWWLDETHQATTVARFDTLFRSHLKSLYRRMDEPVPPGLSVSLVTGTEHGSAPTMRPARE